MLPLIIILASLFLGCKADYNVFSMFSGATCTTAPTYIAFSFTQTCTSIIPQNCSTLTIPFVGLSMTTQNSCTKDINTYLSTLTTNFVETKYFSLKTYTNNSCSTTSSVTSGVAIQANGNCITQAIGSMKFTLTPSFTYAIYSDNKCTNQISSSTYSPSIFNTCNVGAKPELFSQGTIENKFGSGAFRNGGFLILGLVVFLTL